LSSQNDYNPDNTLVNTPQVLQNTWNDLYYKVTTLQTDYVDPLNERTRLDFGYKSIIRNNDNNFHSESYSQTEGRFTNDSNISNHFIYHEQIHAVYGIYNHTQGVYGFQAGLRAEEALTGSTLVNTNKSYTSNYFNLFPSMHAQRNFGERHSLNLSYTRKINRPSPRALNPFTDYTDPLNLRYGNPYLKPEYITNIELAHKYNWKKFLLTSSVYYRHTVNVIQQVKTIAPSGVSTNTNVNLSSSDNYGFEMITRAELYKWWNITGNFEFYHTKLNGSNINADLSNSGYSWYAKIVSGFTIMKGLQTQISANYQAPMVIAQGIIKANYSADWGMKKEIMKGKGSIGAGLSDIFNTRQFVYSINDPSFIYYSVKKRESRVFTVNLTYRIGQSSDNGSPGKRMEGKSDEGGGGEE
jgi:outer membrane receptor protein involved in Fe transport